MPFKDPSKAKAYRARKKDDPEYQAKMLARRELNKEKKKLYDAQRRKSLPKSYRKKINERFWQKKKADPQRHAASKEVQRRQARERSTSNRIGRRLRERIRNALKCQGMTKSNATKELTGATVDEVRAMLESKFWPGMTWDNAGSGEGKWNIDHILPLASFDLTDPENQKIAFNISNLQPLWWRDNLEKSDQLEWRSS